MRCDRFVDAVESLERGAEVGAGGGAYIARHRSPQQRFGIPRQSLLQAKGAEVD
jgi:hypothetical protein